MKLIGFIIVAVGLILTIFTSFKFFTKEKVVDVGRVEISRDKPTNLAWSPLVGIAVICVGGIVLYATNKKN